MKLFKLYLSKCRRLKKLREAYYQKDAAYRKLEKEFIFAKECIKECSNYANGHPNLYIMDSDLGKLRRIRAITDEAILRLGE